MKISLKLIIWLFVILFSLYTVYSLYGLLFGFQFQKNKIREQLFSLYSALNLGMSKIDAEQIINEKISRRLHVYRYDSTNWMICNPGVSVLRHNSDWSIWLEFESDKLSAVRVRGVSGKDGMKPTNSPPDKCIQANWDQHRK